jgi:glycosyltransferase involved in cell wall biosynthesis
MNPSHGLSGQPTNLHVSHSWGGGLSVWIDDFCEADPHADNLVLESVGTENCYGIEFRLRHPASKRTLAAWVFRDPINEVRSSHAEYRKVLHSILEQHEISHIYISSLIGHSLDLFRLGVKATVIYHDYFPFCPALYLTRNSQCTSCTVADLSSCKESSVGIRPRSSPAYYVKFRDEYFSALKRAAVFHVAPSSSVAKNLRQIDARFSNFPFTIVEHGIPFKRQDTFGGASEGRQLRVGVLGVLPWYKGARALERNFQTARTIVDFYFIGSHYWAADFVGRWGAHHVPTYERHELAEILAKCRLDLALFYSMVPETFSYTLSEARCFCVPPLARRIGAHEERIQHGNDGFLFELEEEHLIDSLLELDRDRDPIRQVAARLREQPVRGIGDAVRDFYAMRNLPTPQPQKPSNLGQKQMAAVDR